MLSEPLGEAEADAAVDARRSVAGSHGNLLSLGLIGEELPV